jgi:iron(III) transport system substrate-binding protein
MRHRYLTAILTTLLLAATPLAAFEVEATKFYDGPEGDNRMRIISTADLAVFEPIIRAFQQLHPDIDVDYTVASSTELMAAIYDEGQPFDLAISSAMDLQTKLANDGYALTYQSTATNALPDWATWRNQLFAFTQEPAVMVISEAAFKDILLPTTREDLIELLRDHPEHFMGRIGTYDVRTSGLGYLFATQDSRNTGSYWRLTELMGRLDAKLYCCSAQMITDIAEGRLAFAYNVLGSYANSRLKDTPGIRVVPFNDFLSVMLRTALIPKSAENPEAGGVMIDFLSTLNLRPELTRQTGLPPISRNIDELSNAMRPIRLGPGLLVFLDRLQRETFLRSWASSMEQE